MICAEAKELLEAYVKGETDAAAREALEAHFATCQGCRLEVELTRGVNGEADANESAPLALEPLTTAPLSDVSVGTPEPQSFAAEPLAAAPPAAAPPPPPPEAAPAPAEDEEVSFRDLVLESPEATSTAAPPTPAPSVSAGLSGARPGEAPMASATAPSRKESTPSWDFEPVEPPRESGPPAGSVDLAERAIARKAEAKAKGKVAALRVVLWAAGGLSGIALLGVSIWIALAFNQPSPEQPGPSVEPAPQSSTAPDVAAPDSEVPVDPTTGQPVAPGDGTAQTVPPSTDASVPSDGAVGEAAIPSDGRVLRAGSLPSGGAGPSEAIVPPPKPPRPTPAASKVTTAPSPRTTPSGSASTARSPTETPVAVPSTGSKKPIGPKPAKDDLEPVTDESQIPFTTGPRREPAPARAPAAGGTVSSTTPKPATSGTVPTAPAGGSESTAPVEPTPAPAAAPTKPIDKLHVATVEAAAAEDQAALRKLKISWKSMIKSATAAERARAKREYADCLWAIQELSGKTADRREALAAYREYVLYAPAGANDSRTVGRMRFLEDVLSETE